MCYACRLESCECERVAGLSPQHLEAEVWALMAKMKRIKDRGFDTHHERADLHTRIDLRLDAISLRTDLTAGLASL